MKENIEVIIDENEKSEFTSLKDDSMIDIDFSKNTKLTNKIMIIMVGIKTIIEGTWLAQANHRAYRCYKNAW